MPKSDRANQPSAGSTASSPLSGGAIICRACGCHHFWVLYTRRDWGGRILRRRECRHCRQWKVLAGPRRALRKFFSEKDLRMVDTLAGVSAR